MGRLQQYRFYKFWNTYSKKKRTPNAEELTPNTERAVWLLLVIGHHWNLKLGLSCISTRANCASVPCFCSSQSINWNRKHGCMPWDVVLIGHLRTAGDTSIYQRCVVWFGRLPLLATPGKAFVNIATLRIVHNDKESRAKQSNTGNMNMLILMQVPSAIWMCMYQVQQYSSWAAGGAWWGGWTGDVDYWLRVFGHVDVAPLHAKNYKKTCELR